MRAAPQREPQFDDEIPSRRLTLVHSVPQDLPAELPFPVPVPIHAPTRRRLALVPGAKDDRGAAGPDVADRSGPPDPARFGRQFAQGLIEVLSGRRPAVQLTRHVSPAVQRGLNRSGAGHQLRGAVAPVLHSIHLSEPADGVCELSAIVAVGPRYRALAARLEWKLDHWLCTALQVG